MSDTSSLEDYKLSATATRLNILRKARRRQERTLNPFRFMDLPLELRLMIYRMVLDFGSIERYFETYTQGLVARQVARYRNPPFVLKACPGILRVNKEISREALPVLYRTPLNFYHGVIGATVTSVISPHLLRKLTHVTVTDAGVSLSRKDLALVFHGIQHLLDQLARIWQDGHSLRVFSFIVRADDFNFHLINCATDPTVSCGIKKFLANFKRSVGRLHGVEQVMLDAEMPEESKENIITSMTSPAQTFFKLPLNLRRSIYQQIVDVNDASQGALETYMTQLNTSSRGDGTIPALPTLSTPPILLVNHQMHDEIKSVIRETPLTVSGRIHPTLVPPPLTSFISPAILRSIDHLKLDFTHWRYATLIPSLVDVFVARNAADDPLRSFALHFEDNNHVSVAAEQRDMTVDGHYPDKQLAHLLMPLGRLRNIRSVWFGGEELPDCFIGPLMVNMQLGVGADGVPYMAKRIRGNGAAAAGVEWLGA